MPSFDIVSEINQAELQNAVDNASRELSSRYDFRGTEAAFNLDKSNLKVKLEAPEEFQIQQMDDILTSKLAKRGIEVLAAEFGEITRSGKRSVQEVSFKEGIDRELAKKIIKLVKDLKLKVDAKINDEAVRVTGKKRDDLQLVMAAVRQAELGQPLQFNNFRD